MSLAAVASTVPSRLASSLPPGASGPAATLVSLSLAAQATRCLEEGRRDGVRGLSPFSGFQPGEVSSDLPLRPGREGQKRGSETSRDPNVPGKNTRGFLETSGGGKAFRPCLKIQMQLKNNNIRLKESQKGKWKTEGKRSQRLSQIEDDHP